MSDSHYSDYWGNQAVEHQISEDSTMTERSGERQADPIFSSKVLEDYWGSSNRPPMPIETIPDTVAWTIESAETLGEDTGAVDVTGAPENVKVDTSGLGSPSRTEAGGRDEIGYGAYGARAPFIPSAQQEFEQRILIAVAEKIVAEQRALLTQTKVAEHAHFESWPFIDGEIVPPTTRIGTRHPNGIGYLLLASAAGLFVGENQSVGSGNLGIPVPTGTVFLRLDVNTDLWVSSSGVALAQATSLYIVQLYMGSTTL